MRKKEKILGTDGLGPHEKKKLHQACRLVWQRCHARRLAQKRCTGENGFYYCEICSAMTPTIKIDHIKPVGSVGNNGYLSRLFCPSSKLQGICPGCHRSKTKEERAKP